jgi:predicted MFS family arabinose efflux permease
MAGVTTIEAMSHRLGFLSVAFAYLAVMALSAAPSPLYPLYGFATLTVTLIYAAYAVGVAASLFLAGHLSDAHGRRRLIVPGVVLAGVAAAAFAASASLPALLLARVAIGVAVGLVTATATAWLTELDAKLGQWAAIAINVGGLGVGTLLAGALAQYAPDPLRTPYVVLLAALALALLGVASAPETRARPASRPRYRPQRVSFSPAAAGAALLGFASLGLFAGLAGTLLAGTLHHPSRLLAGSALAVVFGAAAAIQLAAQQWTRRTQLRSGMCLIVGGLALTALAAWAPSLAVFLLGGALTGAGAGAMFKGALATVVARSAPEARAEALAGLFLAGYVGLSVPVIGLGVALQALSAKVTLLGFAAAVAAGIAAAARPLLGSDAAVEPLAHGGVVA